MWGIISLFDLLRNWYLMAGSNDYVAELYLELLYIIPFLFLNDYIILYLIYICLIYNIFNNY